MKDDPRRVTRERNRAKAIEQSLITTPTDPVAVVDVPIGKLPDDVAKRLAEDLGLGQVSADLSHVLAKHGAQFDSAAALNAAAGSSLINSSTMTQKLIQVAAYCADRESFLLYGDLLNETSKTLTKVNESIAKQRVNIARANTGIRSVQSRMFVPQPSFAPGQQIEIVDAVKVESK